MNLYCVLGSVGLITPLHIASEPIVFHANPRRCKAARTLVLRRLLSRITPFPPFWLPLNGYRVPHEPAHQKSCFKGFPAVDETASAVHAAAAIGFATAAASGLVKKRAHHCSRVGSSSDMYMMSRSIYPSALQVCLINKSSITNRGNA